MAEPEHKPNRLMAALREDANLVGVAVVAAASIATGGVLPLIAGVIAEAAYLLFVPDSRWYDARLSRRHDAEIERRRAALKAQVLPTLRAEMQERFSRLEQTRADIQAQPMEETQLSDKDWFRRVLRKLDYLMEKFLLFASKEMQFRSYLQSVLDEVRAPSREIRRDRERDRDQRPRRGILGNAPPAPAQPAQPQGNGGIDASLLDPDDRRVQGMISEVQAHYEQELTGLRQMTEAEADVSTKAVLEKRCEVLEKRQEFMGKLGRILTNLNHQLKLLEDSFGLINDQIRARSPEQVLADIDDVVGQTDSMTRLLEEMAPYEQMLARLST